jgi:hypothetical protein
MQRRYVIPTTKVLTAVTMLSDVVLSGKKKVNLPLCLTN